MADSLNIPCNRIKISGKINTISKWLFALEAKGRSQQMSSEKNYRLTGGVFFLLISNK